MTEEEAAERLCALLNEFEAAGHQVECDSRPFAIWVGDVEIAGPPCEDEPWEVRL